MADFTDDEKKRLLDMATLMLGMNGQAGFCKRIETQLDNYCLKHDNLVAQHNKLNLQFWKLVAYLIGSGVLVGGGLGFAVLRLVAG